MDSGFQSIRVGDTAAGRKQSGRDKRVDQSGDDARTRVRLGWGTGRLFPRRQALVGLPGPAVTLLAAGLSYVPEDRPQSVLVFVRTLAAALAVA